MTSEKKSTRITTIGTYTLLGIIGKGTFAKVYLARNIEGEKVTLRVSFKKSSKIMFDYRRSISALQKLDHECIVKMIEYFEWRNCFVIVMEYLQMVTLEEMFLEGYVLGLEDKVLIMKQCADAMVHLKERGVSHRDIKMENVMVCPDTLRVKIIDFGFACRNDIICSDAMGTPYYMAPEVLTGKKYSPEFSDMWSLGVLFFVVLFSELPFPADSIDELRRMASSPNDNLFFTERLDTLPAPLVNAMTGLFQPDPQTRMKAEDLSYSLSLHEHYLSTMKGA